MRGIKKKGIDKMKKKLTALLLAAGLILSACGQASENSQDKGVTTLKVAHTQNSAPYNYINDKGESDGFEVQVLKAIDERLEDYQFEYTGTSDEDLLIGLESGKYDIGSKAAWYTSERAEKFILPKEPIGASVIGFAIRSEDKDKFTDIDSFAEKSGKLVPISPQSGQYNVIEEYNKNHSDHPIDLIPSETFDIADAYAWVLEGRYDAFFNIKISFDKSVKDPKGPYHKFADKLAYFPYKAIPTYPIIRKTEENQKFAEEYDKVIKELHEDGTIEKLSQEYFGENVFELVD